MKKFWLVGWIVLLLSACAFTETPAPPSAPTSTVAAPTVAPPAGSAPTRAVATSAANATSAPTPMALSVENEVAFVERLTGRAAYEHTRYLTSEALMGRKAGTRGADLAADYIADKFKAAGLKPANADGSYFQTLTYSFIDLAAPPTLALLNADNSVKRALKLRIDYRESSSWLASNGQAEGQVVFLGRGTDKDFARAGDLKNKIALVFQPQNTRVADWANTLWNRGISGVLVISNNASNIGFKSSYIVGAARANETRPLFVVTREVAEQLLANSGASLQELEERANRDGTFAETPNRVRMSLQLELREATTRNVIGVLPGSDAALSDEYVIVGGHYDFVGDDPGGVHFQGANDNASGAAVVTALAEYFGQNHVRLKRTLVFAAWTAEESGLIGSNYYTEHPLFPLKQTKGYINLDVVGAGSGEGLNVTNDSPTLNDLVRASAKDLNIKTGREAIGGGSDHESFVKKGVPAVFLIWQGYGEIHVPSDTFEKIDVEKLRATAQVAALTMIRLGLP